jgi:ClpP class serine protease
MSTNNFRVLSQILRADWMIETESAMALMPAVASFLKGEQVNAEAFGIGDGLTAIALQGAITYDREFGFSNARPGDVAIIRAMGPLLKYDTMCGPIGMNTIGDRIREAEANANISGVVLYADSPGGSVDGTIALGELVKNTKKPVVTFVDGMAASAMLWIAASSAEIIASTDMAIVGSVGVASNFMNTRPVLEKMGVEFHDLVADQSFDKNKSVNLLLKGDYETYKAEVLNPLAERFQQHMKATRPLATDEFLTGKTYFAKDVMGVFVDGIGDLEFAVSRVRELSRKNVSLKGISTPSEKGNNQLKLVSMNKEQLKAEHPALYAEVFKEGVEQERDRVGAFMAFQESSPEAVKAAIENGDVFTNKQAAQLAAAMAKQALNMSEKTPDTNAVTTPPAPKADDKSASETEAFAALKKAGLTFKEGANV